MHGILLVIFSVSMLADARVHVEKNSSNTVITAPANFHLDMDGVSVAINPHVICVLERKPGIDVGGKVVCWGDEYYEKGKFLKPPDVSSTFSFEMITFIQGFDLKCR